MTFANTLSSETIDMLPEYYYAGTFDLMVRDADSVAVFWDLARTSTPPHLGARLSLRITDYSGEEQILILNQRHGHMLVPIYSEGSHFSFSLGWSDQKGFTPIATESADLPPCLHTRRPEASMEAARHSETYSPLAHPVERRGFSPPISLS